MRHRAVPSGKGRSNGAWAVPSQLGGGSATLLGDEVDPRVHCCQERAQESPFGRAR